MSPETIQTVLAALAVALALAFLARRWVRALRPARAKPDGGGAGPGCGTGGCGCGPE